MQQRWCALRQVSHTCDDLKRLLFEQQKAFRLISHIWTMHKISHQFETCVNTVTNFTHFMAELLTDMKRLSLTYMFWSLKADPAHRRPEATLRVAGEGEPFLQFAL